MQSKYGSITMTKKQCEDIACHSASNYFDPQIELRELKYKAKLLRDHMKVGIIWSHPAGRIVETNQFITHLTGYRCKELEGCIVFDLFYQDQDHNKPELGAAITTGIVKDLCVAVKRKDGMRIWTRLTVIPARYLRRPYLLLLLEPMRAAPASETIHPLKATNDQFQRVARIIGKSKKIEKLCMLSSKAAHSDCTILIQGASGTGKEIFADAIRKHSRRARQPYVRVNCVAISETLLESELFGHVKGAFTGAIRDRKGRFQQGNNGTILLDEIGSMSLAGQAKILRVLQEREFEPVGSSKTIQCDIRIIATTNVDLKKAVQQRRFREDLYYRLSVLTINLPPLRERKDDIPLLALYFLQKYADRTQKSIVDFHPETMSVLLNYDWPGNVRELKI